MAIAEKNLSFNWCQSGIAFHFRQVYCYESGKPICVDCAKTLGLKITEETRPPTSIKAPSASRNKRSTELTSVAKAILQSLQDICLSSEEIYKKHGGNYSCYDSFARVLRNLLHRNLIVTMRQRARMHKLYALPGNEHLISQRRSLTPLEHEVLDYLSKNGETSFAQIGKGLRRGRLTIYKVIKRLASANLVALREVEGLRGKYLLCSVVK